MPTFTAIVEILQLEIEFVSIVGQAWSQIWDRILPGRSRLCNLEKPRSVSTQERQDYAAYFGLSSEPFGQVFETAFPNVT
jgi:hypothetical protein